MEEDNKGRIFQLKKYHIDNIENDIKHQIKHMQDYITHLFNNGRIILNQHDHPYSLNHMLWKIHFYRIPIDEKIKISPIVASSLGITKKKLDSANEKLNNKLAEINQILENEYQEIQILLDEFEKIKKEMTAIFDAKIDAHYSREEYINEQFQSIVDKMRNVVFNNCYFLDNENSLLFFHSNDREYRRDYINEQYLNSRNPIIEAFDTFLHNSGVLNLDLSFTQKDKLTEQQIKKSIRALNTEFLPGIVPNFDDSEIVKFSVDYNNGNFSLYVHEKNGDTVSLSNTSLGRRWYLTYQFVKALLKPGDMLFIDEPATFLHPQAQVEFKQELNKLSKDGVYIFYSTHSPYMIPEDWGQVYNVVMTEHGTEIFKFDSGDDLCKTIKEELGATNAANILFNLEKTVLLVEGVADMACIEKFAEVLKYNISEYKILPCNGSPILDVTYLCIQQGIKFKALLDLDNKSKPQKWLNKKYGYNEYLKIFETNKNCVFTLPIRNQKSLEDCFHENDNIRYFFDYIWQDKSGVQHVERKINKNKIKKATKFEDETKNNFEQLFKDLRIPKLDDVNS
ncbi:MAG: AAA family ATPase [Clostridiales bacterium]|nr:AAA family ATPase [Clostridiales bacterium]